MRKKKIIKDKRDLLVGVIKRKSDLKLLLERRSYRIPIKKVNPEGIKYIAFYLPSKIFKNGKRIEIYGRVSSYKIIKRGYLPNLVLSMAEKSEDYFNFYIEKIFILKDPIINKSHMRITFKRTESALLRRVSTVAMLYDIKPLEDIMNEKLIKWGKDFKREYSVKIVNKKFRLDFAFLCRKGILGIECDSKKWHSTKRQVERDRVRDSMLKKAGITLIHLKENEVIMPLKDIAEKIEEKIEKLRGLTS